MSLRDARRRKCDRSKQVIETRKEFQSVVDEAWKRGITVKRLHKARPHEIWQFNVHGTHTILVEYHLGTQSAYSHRTWKSQKMGVWAALKVALDALPYVQYRPAR